MLRQGVKLHDGGGGEGGDIGDAGYTGRAGPRAGVDDDQIGAELAGLAVGQPQLQGLRPGEARGGTQQVEAIGLLDAALAAATEARDDVALALAHARQVYGDRAGMHAVIGAATREVGNAGAGYHGLGWGAAFVDAGAADVLALDEGSAPSRAGERGGERAAALAGADHDGVVGG